MEVVEKNNLGFVYQLYLHLSKFNLSYIYKGEFSASLNDTILALAEANMQIVNEPDALKKEGVFYHGRVVAKHYPPQRNLRKK